jgi:hypothetical protein
MMASLIFFSTKSLKFVTSHGVQGVQPVLKLFSLHRPRNTADWKHSYICNYQNVEVRLGISMTETMCVSVQALLA